MHRRWAAGTESRWCRRSQCELPVMLNVSARDSCAQFANSPNSPNSLLSHCSTTAHSKTGLKNSPSMSKNSHRLRIWGTISNRQFARGRRNVANRLPRAPNTTLRQVLEVWCNPNRQQLGPGSLRPPSKLVQWLWQHGPLPPIAARTAQRVSSRGDQVTRKAANRGFNLPERFSP